MENSDILCENEKLYLKFFNSKKIFYIKKLVD